MVQHSWSLLTINLTFVGEKVTLRLACHGRKFRMPQENSIMDRIRKFPHYEPLKVVLYLYVQGALHSPYTWRSFACRPERQLCTFVVFDLPHTNNGRPFRKEHIRQSISNCLDLTWLTNISFQCPILWANIQIWIFQGHLNQVAIRKFKSNQLTVHLYSQFYFDSTNR